MANIREERRIARLNKIKRILRSAKQTDGEVNFEMFIATIMSEHGVSRRVAREDIEAMNLLVSMEDGEKNLVNDDRHDTKECVEKPTS